MSTLNVYVPGQGAVSLAPGDHLASGGEGAVYLKNNTIFKVFLDPQRARNAGMHEKLGLLSKLRHPYIVAPTGPLLDARHELVGYTMPVAEGVPLMKTFTNTWRGQNGFTDAMAGKLVDNMRTAVQAAHDMGAVIVDGNEVNYLAHGVEPRLIDVDSWQIGSYPATALMPSIQDYHCTRHDALSDWFSWAIVTFQVFTGLHPYKGTHPGFPRNNLEGRMRANASVFDARVKLNAAVRDFGCIPAPLLAWYEAVLAKGERSAPPDFLATVVPAHTPKRLRVVQQGTGALRHEKLLALPGPVRHVSANGVAYYATAAGLAAYDLVRRQGVPSLSAGHIDALFANRAALLRHGAGFLLLETTGTEISGHLLGAERDPVPAQQATNILPCAADRLVVFGNVAYALNLQVVNGLTELAAAHLGNRTLLTAKAAWPLNAKATRFYDGVAIMDCLGAPFIAVPQPGSMLMLKAPALAGYRVIDGFARSERRVWLQAVSVKDGLIYRLELRADGQQFTLLRAAVTDTPELNVAVSARGIGAGIFEDGTVTVANTQGDAVQEVKDASAHQDAKLFALPDGICYFLGADIFRLTFGR